MRLAVAILHSAAALCPLALTVGRSARCAALLPPLLAPARRIVRRSRWGSCWLPVLLPCASCWNVLHDVHVNAVHAEGYRAGRAQGGCKLRDFAPLPASEAAPESPAGYCLRRPRSAAPWHRTFFPRAFFRRHRQRTLGTLRGVPSPFRLIGADTVLSSGKDSRLAISIRACMHAASGLASG